MSISLPLSKSIANRVLILQAMRGESLLALQGDEPEDVVILHNALTALLSDNPPKRIDVGNCGTAMRFLTAFCAQKKGCTVLLDGSERMRQRPIGQLVDGLAICGADIWYMGSLGYPPLRIQGSKLYFVNHAINNTKYPIHNPDSSQFVSAMMMIGLPVESNSSSPYIRMTEAVMRMDTSHITVRQIERDWSAAAFWYEYIAIHGGELTIEGLTQNTLQGDSCVASLFTFFGVTTTYTDHGIVIRKTGKPKRKWLLYDFKNCPDLYPAVALTCRALGIWLIPRGTKALRIKESDRLQAVKEYRTYGDHRIAMALLAADMHCDDIQCVSKSYPSFYEQLCALQQS